MSEHSESSSPITPDAVTAPASDSPTTSHSDNPGQSGLGTTQPEAKESPAVSDDPRLASRFAALARKDKALREERKRIEADRAQLARWRDAERLAKEDPLKLLEDLGLSYSDLTQRQLQRLEQEHLGDDPAVRLKRIEQQIQDYEEQARQHRERQAQAQVDRQIAQFQRQIEQRIESDPDRFELVIAQGAQEEVFRLIEAHFVDTREVMPIDEAAQLIEDQLLEEARLLLKAKKLAKRESKDARTRDSEQEVGAADETERSEQDRAYARPQVESQTLTNAGTSAAASGIPKAHLDIEDSKRRAAALLKWT